MLTSLQLNNYRNLSLTAQFDSECNLIIAPNGSGKSNFLEALYFLSLGKSFRPTTGFTDFIGNEGSFCVAVAEGYRNTLEVIVSNHTAKLQRKFKLNGKTKSQSAMLGCIPLVLFAPHNVSLVNDDPLKRRDDLDDYLSLLSTTYAKGLRSYNKILKNRNALLKNVRDFSNDKQQLIYWSDELIRLSEEIVSERLAFFEAIQQDIDEAAKSLYHKILKSSDLKFTASYDSKSNTTNISTYIADLRSKLSNNLEKEIVVGQTLYGPHRDDYAVSIDGQNLRYWGSRAQQRIGVFIWKLAQLNYLQSVKSIKAVFLIDDLMSELDPEHRDLVADFLINQKDFQFILTATAEIDVPAKLQEKGNLIRLV